MQMLWWIIKIKINEKENRCSENVNMENNTKEIFEIAKRIDAINDEQMKLSRQGNDLWEERNNLRNRYKELTGNEI